MEDCFATTAHLPSGVGGTFILLKSSEEMRTRIDENLNLNIDNQFLKNYLSKIRGLVEKPTLTPEQQKGEFVVIVEAE